MSYVLALAAMPLADAAPVAPFEYIGINIAVFWGWVMFAEVPFREVWAGIALT